MKNKHSKSNKNTKKPIYIIALMILLCLILMPRSGVKGEIETENNDVVKTEIINKDEEDIAEDKPIIIDPNTKEKIPEEENSEIPNTNEKTSEEENNENSNTNEEIPEEEPTKKDRLGRTIKNYETNLSYSFSLILRYPDGRPAPNQKLVVDHMVLTTVGINVEDTLQSTNLYKAVTETITSDANGRVVIENNDPVSFSYQPFVTTINRRLMQVVKFPIVKSISLPNGYDGIRHTWPGQPYNGRFTTIDSINNNNIKNHSMYLSQSQIFKLREDAVDKSILDYTSGTIGGDPSLGSVFAASDYYDNPTWDRPRNITYPIDSTNKIVDQQIMNLPFTSVEISANDNPNPTYAHIKELGSREILESDISFYYTETLKPALESSLVPKYNTVTNGGVTEWKILLKYETLSPVIDRYNVKINELILPYGMIRVPGTTKVDSVPVSDSMWSDGEISEFDGQIGIFNPGLYRYVEFKTISTGALGSQQNLGAKIKIDNQYDYSVYNNVTIADEDHNVTGNAPYDDLSMNTVPKGLYFKDVKFSSIVDTTTKLDLTKYLDSTKSEGLKLRINDKRSVSGLGWRLNAKMKQFESVTQPGYYMNNVALNMKAGLAEIENPDQPNEVTNNSPTGSNVPNATQDIHLLGNNTAVIIVDAASGQGAGCWLSSYALNDINLTIPKGQGIAGMEYQSTVTWTLEDVP